MNKRLYINNDSTIEFRDSLQVETTSAPLEDRKCTCSIQTLMQTGCKCGCIERERKVG